MREDDPEESEGQDTATEPGDPASARRQGPLPAAVPPPDKPRSRFVAWWSAPITVLTVALVMVLLLALTVTLGITAVRRGGPAPAGGESLSSAEPVPARPTPRPRPSAAASPGTDAVPPVDPAVLGIPYTSGAFQANDGTFIDFDDNHRSGRRSGESDIQVDDFGITGVNAVPLVVVGTSDPMLIDCTAVPPQDWVVTVPTEELTVGTRVCFRTSEQRYGFFTVMRTRYTNADTFIGLELAYLVWEGPDDSQDR